MDNSFDDESEDEDTIDDDDLSFISRKTRKMWRNKNGSRWKKSCKRFFKEIRDNEKTLYFGCLWATKCVEAYKKKT